jgi:translation initiation factor 3 subunit D
MGFEFPPISSNFSGWGPLDQTPAGFDDVPYAPFSKTDRIGKIADWNAPPEDSWNAEQQQQQNFRNNRRRFGAPTEAFGAGMASAFSYAIQAEDEADFSLVDRAQAPKKPSAFKPQKPQGPWAPRQQQQQGGKPDFNKGYQNKRVFGRRMADQNARIREPSIKIGHDWSLVEEMDFVRLSKLYYDVEEPKDVYVFIFFLFLSSSGLHKHTHATIKEKR